MIIDLVNMPDFNPSTQAGDRGDWSLRDVSSGQVWEHPTWHVECVEHGAMNAVNPDRTIWRCLACGRAAYRPSGG